MNNATRKELSDLLTKVGQGFAAAKLEELTSALETLQNRSAEMASDEEDKYSNLSEGLQASEKGTALQEAAEGLNEIAEACKEALDAIETLEEKTEEVRDHDVP